MRERLILKYFASLIFVAIVGATWSVAQDPDDIQNGIKAYGTYRGGDIDSVSMTNGNLSVSIPLVSYPQRGKLHLSYSLVYTNKPVWQMKTICGVSCTTFTTRGYNDLYASTLGMQAVLDQGFDLWSQSVQASEYNYFTSYSLYTPDGSSHQLAAVSSTNYETVDGTGLQAYLPTSGTSYVLDADGTKRSVGFNATTQEDTNGNQISVNSGLGVLDTVGRTIPAFPSKTSGSGNCPSGPLPVSAYGQWAVPGPNGGTSTFLFCWAQVQILTALITSPGEPPEYLEPYESFLQSLVLPNGTAWTFTYSNDFFGNLTQITFPTGGTISYTWADAGIGISPSVASRTVNANDGTGNQTWSYSYTGGTNTSTTTVSDPLGNSTVYTNTCFGTCGGYTTKVQYYQGSSNLVKTVSTTYFSSASPFGGDSPVGVPNMNVVPTQITTTWAANGKTDQVSKGYDAGFTFPDPNGNGTNYTGLYGKVITQKDYDYGTTSGVPGPLLRQTNTSYVWQSPNPSYSSYLSNNMLNLVYSTQITDGSNQKAYTQYGYDETTPTPSGLGASQNLDTSVWTIPYRGNQTSVNRWLNLPTVQTLTSKTTYYDTGMPLVAKDPLHNPTTYFYSGTFQDAYVTQVENALNQSVYYNYDYDTGLKTSTTDLNGQITTDSYDTDWRLLTDIRPTGGGETSFCYTDLDAGGNACLPNSVPFQAVITKEITSAINEIVSALVDGVGRLDHTQLDSNPGCVIYVDTTYDGVGNKASVSNPYCTTSDSTYGITTDAYDALHRVTQVTQSDGSLLKTAYCANTTLVTDEAGHWRRSTVDGLGRLIEVDEPNSPTATVNSNGCPGGNDPIWVTTYGYDQLGDLLSVVQVSSRQRNFTYDSLSRLLTATNPESGTLTYTYDADGNTLTKKTLSPNQGSTGTATVTTTYTYDQLNRLTGKSYSDGYTSNNPTPGASYAYDGNVLTGCITTPPTLTDSYPVGHRTSMCDGSGATSWSHDTMGRLLQERRTIGTITGEYETDAYNLDGSVSSATSLGYSVGYTYSAAARPLTATHSTTKFVSGATYAAPGELTGGTLGSASGFAGITIANAYNKRLQPILLSAASPTSTVFSECFDFHLGVAVTGPAPCSFSAYTTGDNGNLYQIVNNRDNTRNQNFIYDQLNRIQQGYSSGTQWGETFGPTATSPGVAPSIPGIDSWGNLVNRSGVTGKTYYEPLSVSAGTNNQLSGFGYDPAGNMTGNGSASYVYDDENRLIATAGYSYLYDGDGERVEKCTEGTKPGTCATSATGTLYWRGAGSEPLTETDLSGNVQNTYIFFDGQRVARSDSAGAIHYYFSDHLGTHGVVENATGSACEQDVDYYPYGGEENDYCATQVAQNYKFTGKERDSESGLDNFGARYDASSLGRFMTPDWAAKPISVPYAKFGDPQTLNLYAYVENSPLNRIDADGHDSPGQMCPDCISQSQTESQVSDTNSGAAATTSAQASRANTAQTNLALSWLNVIEVSGSYGWSVGVSGQAGSAEYQATSGVTTEGTIGLGGGNGEVKVSGDVVNGKVKLGDYEGSVKAGVEVSSKDGVTAKAGAEVSAGALKAGVSVDKGGVHTSVGAEKNGDIKLGAHVQGGLGGGLNINFSQAGRAFDQSVQSVNALGQYLMNKFMPSGSIF